jgi:predicted membrane protein
MGDFEENPMTTPERGRFTGHFGSSTIFALMLVLGGTLLMIDNLNILPFELSGIFWPLTLLVASLLYLTRCIRPTGQVWAGAGILAGILLILGHFHVLHVNDDIIAALFLIALGIVMLINRTNLGDLGSRFRRDRHRFGVTIGASRATRGDGDGLVEFAIFSGVKRRIEAQSFEGGEVTTLFGGIEIDLRRAGMTGANPSAVIEANAAFGGVEIRIPENWRLSMQGTAVFGAYEDKTIPPRPEPGVEIPLLVIRGATAFGAVVVKN